MGDFKIPWWAAFPISGGVTLMTAFAGSTIQPWLQVAGFWLGALLFGWGILATVWHYRPHLPPFIAHPLGGRTREVWSLDGASRWATVDPLTIAQAAALWVGVDPVPEGNPVCAEAGAQLAILKTAARARKLRVQAAYENMINVINLERRAWPYTPGSGNDLPDLPNATLVMRSRLRDFAEREGGRPEFLFPLGN